MSTAGSAKLWLAVTTLASTSIFYVCSTPASGLIERVVNPCFWNQCVNSIYNELSQKSIFKIIMHVPNVNYQQNYKTTRLKSLPL